MKARLSCLGIFLTFFSAIATDICAQTLVEGYAPKVAGTPYHRITADHDGNILVYQHFDHVNGDYIGSLAKLDGKGQMVAGFNKVLTNGTIGHAQALPDGKILISGDFTSINGHTTSGLVRLNQDGTLDTSFTPGIEQAAYFRLQSDGKIIVAVSNSLVRLNADGTLDETFSMSGYFYSFSPIEIGPDDHIYISMYSQVHRLKPNGEDDPDFFVGTGVNQHHISSIEAQSDGKVLVAGFFTEYNGFASNSLVRLLPDGQVDTGFNVGKGPESQVLEIIERANKNILLGGVFSQYNDQAGSLVELKPDGSLHKIIAIVSMNYITSIVEAPDGRITLAGEFSTVNSQHRPFLVKFNTDYTINSDFSPLITYNNPNGRFLEVRKTGEVITGGHSDFGGVFRGADLVDKEIVQLDAFGTCDKSFFPQIPQYNPFIVSTFMAEDGKILLGGFVDELQKANLVRLNADGSRDNSFQIGTGPTTDSNLAGMPYRIKEKDNTLYVAGYFTKFNHIATSAIVTLYTDGTIRQTFSALPEESQVNDFDLQSDGKIIAVGYFPFGVEGKQVVRLNTNGSVDQNFALTHLTGNVNVIMTDSLDRIYLGGSLLTAKGALSNSLVRLLPDGNLDPGFNIGSGFTDNESVAAIEFLPNGNLAVGGYFGRFKNEEVNGFVILDENGAKVSTPWVKFGRKSVAIKMKHINGALYVGGRLVKEDYSDVYGMAKISILPVTLPQAPDNLTVKLHSDNVLELQWNDNSSDELAFMLERSIESESAFVPIDTMRFNAVNVLDHGIEPHKTYYYRLKALNDAGASDYSNIASFKWVIPPAAQLKLTITEYSENEFLLTWEGNATGHVGFVIERSEDLLKDYSVLDTVTSDTYTYIDAVEREKPYYYKVAAYNEAGRIASNEVTSIISGLTSAESPLAVFPVPANQVLFVRISDQQDAGEWQLIATTGQNISLKPEVLGGTHRIDLSQVPPGIYTARYSNAGKTLLMQRIVVQR